ncbi:MAG: outer membrane lipoprotein carrier protein LolA [Acidobacteriota bacterium]|nr:outer membrane lipoprotein carrier protein LolA [Acidobacteriota bacterium]
MDSARISLLFLLLGFFTGLPSGAMETVPAAPGLESVLEKMDRRGGNLQSMSARIIQKKWTDILEEFDEEERGEFHFLRENEAIRLRRDITEPGVSTLLINDGKGIFYQPLLKQANRYDLGARKDRAEFLLLGFTSKKEALRDAYSIRWLGPEMVGGRETYALELTPRSGKVSAFFSRIVLWVDGRLWVPIQQKLVEPTRDYLLIRFEDVRLNLDLPASRFELELPSDVNVIQF